MDPGQVWGAVRSQTVRPPTMVRVALEEVTFPLASAATQASLRVIPHLAL